MVRIKLFEKILNNNSGSSSGGNNTGRSSKSNKSGATSRSQNAASNAMAAAVSSDNEANATSNSTTSRRSSCSTRATTSSAATAAAAAAESAFAANSILSENFICNCCLEVLKNPCTLMCGHSFCQVCLADWYLISSNRRCPICRQEWYGVPKQNQALKSTIKKLIKYDPTTNSTYNDKLTKDEEKKLKTFHQKCHQYSSSWSSLTAGMSSSNVYPNTHQRGSTGVDNGGGVDGDENFYFAQQSVGLPHATSLNNFFTGLFFGVLLACVALTLGSLMFSSSSKLSYKESRASSLSSLNKDNYYYQLTQTSAGPLNGVAMLRRKFAKPIELWSSGDIQEWLYSLGPWTNKIAIVAQSLKIDGLKLIQLNETSLREPPFGVKEDEHRKLLIDSIRVLKGCRQTAVNFWEVKNKNRLAFVMFGMFFESLPRLTVLYYYMVDDEMTASLNVLAGMSFEMNENDYVLVENAKKSMLYGETLSTKSSFSSLHALAFYTKIPYMRFKSIFSLFFYESNKPLSVFIAIRCALLTFLDILFFVDLLRSLIEFDKDRLKNLLNGLLVSNAKAITIITLVYMFWNFIPNLFIDVFFFYLLFLRVFFNVNSLLNNFKAFLESIGHYFIRPNH